MDTEVLLRLIAIAVAASLLFVNFDVKPYVTYVKNLFKRKPSPEVQGDRGQPSALTRTCGRGRPQKKSSVRM